MSARVFVDTNVLVYVKDQTNPLKRKAAEVWLAALAAKNAAVISRQSLREYYKVATKPKVGALKAAIRREVLALHAWLPSDGGVDRLTDAWDIQDRFQLSFYDALLLASANAARCTHFLSEDMQDGLDVNGTRILSFTNAAPSDVLKD
jgi:predicted nucleic acid-binding protein